MKMKIPLHDIFIKVSLLLLVVVEARHSSSCQKWQADVIKAEASVKVSQNYKGLWISEKCEIHPGPQFILRRYHLSRGGHFSLVRFHYLDPWCTAPAFSVSAVGKLVPSPDKATSAAASWVVPGGLELDYDLRRVVLVPFTLASAGRLAHSVNESCPGSVVVGWKPFKKYKVLSYEGRNARKVRKVNHRCQDPGLLQNTDCTRGLDLNFDELQLMRLEHRTPLRFRQRTQDGSRDTSQRYQSHLYLGAQGFPKGSRPTYYQTPLLPAQVVHCPTCRSVSKSSSISPPVLLATYSSDPPPSGLSGQWISLRCEVRPYGLFLRRTFIFGGPTQDKKTNNNHWQAQHSYYRDENCNSPMFTLAAKGVYHPGQPSEAVADATEYDFHIDEAYVTPEDIQFANNLKGILGCGSHGKWRVGTMGNLTGYGGCRELGITVPSVELDIIRFGRDGPDLLFLYLGETTKNGGRATSFQPPLVRCSVSDEAANADDYFLNFNELQPLPLTSWRSSAESGSISHIAGDLLWYLMMSYAFYLLH